MTRFLLADLSGHYPFFAPQEPPPAWPLDTPGGRYYAELDLEAPVTREGQLIFFAQFLDTGGRWARLLEGCPLRYHGNRGSGACDGGALDPMRALALFTHPRGAR